MGSCIAWRCFQGRSGGGYGTTGIAISMQLARAGTWLPRSSHKSRMGYLPWLMSCWLLRLNSGLRREHPTSELSWVATWLLVTRVFPVYLVKERYHFGGICLSLGGSWEGWESRELGKRERCMSGVRWQGGKGGRIVRCHSRRGGKVVRWQFGKGVWRGGSEMARQERLESSEVARWEIPCFIHVWGRRVRPRFHLFVSNTDQRNEGAWCVQDILEILNGKLHFLCSVTSLPDIMIVW